jgi:hypothetical protein
MDAPLLLLALFLALTGAACIARGLMGPAD